MGILKKFKLGDDNGILVIVFKMWVICGLFSVLCINCWMVGFVEFIVIILLVVSMFI